ncbi:MAG: helix-turn-helix domain-containing protein [Neisseria sp.]|uniref:helix-turn-helix domain-containing protein n=1 Tax=Neisseria sp. TaxID=192066 RepID=UPI0026DC3499|nr:helix-turn-helix domain-containing protein [Neisseria sp.]MDO4641682.1 helix-turn-helix domain-containing protein [Neisseria sp.]
MKTYDVNAAAKYCQCHPETIRQYIRQGVLVASKPGRKYCITQSALDVFLNHLENDAVQASLEHRSEQKCQSINEKMDISRLISGSKAVAELDNLLARKTSRKPKGCTTN